MPIRPENKGRYPKNWPKISASIRLRANEQCEKCRAPNGVMIRRGKALDGTAVWMLANDDTYRHGLNAETGRLHTSAEDGVVYGEPVRVVLTVAHLDHVPENCDPSNLRAWCQRCHNAYDAPMRRAGISARARAARAVGDLFEGVPL